LLGVPEVSPDDDFFALGGHSLLAVRLAFQIEKRFGQKLSLVTIFEFSTLRRMAARIQASQPAPAPAKGRKLIRPMQTEGDLPPILCMAAGPLFRTLASALAPRCPFFSVAHPGWYDNGLDTIEKLAAVVAQEIRETYAGRPVVLAGWCLAGLLAIDVTHQLEQAGHPVASVILFDTLNPVKRRQWFAPAPMLRQWQVNAHKARFHAGRAFSNGLTGAPAFLWDKLRDARQRAKYDRLLRAAGPRETDQAEVPLDFEETYRMLALRYTPRPVRAQILQVLPEHQIGGQLFAGDLGWSKFGYRVETVTAPGDHRGMLTGDNAAVIARHLVARLEAIRPARRAASA
jgi:thioesterase domain-containing protein/acyl carrier protein